MFSHISFGAEQFQTQIAVEDLRLELRGSFAIDTMKQLNLNWSDFEFKLRRNLRDDTFSVWLTHPTNATTSTSTRLFYTQINVNNKASGHSAKDGDYPRMERQDFIHHSVIDSISLRTARLISVDWSVSQNSSQATALNLATPLINLTVLIDPVALPNTLDLKSNEVGLTQALKELTIKFLPDTMPSTGRFTTGLNSARHFDVVKSFNYAILKPRPIVQGAFTRDVLELYAFNENNSDLAFDFLTEDVSYRVSTLTGELSAMHFYSSEPSVMAGFRVGEVESRKSIQPIGLVRLNESMYYDYAKKSVVKGVAEHSRIGELVPHSFKGDYYRQMEVSVNQVFKKFKLRYHKTINTPLLEPFSGQVQLTISASNQASDKLRFKLSLTQVKKVRERIEAKAPLPLSGLRRLSDAA